MYNPWMVHEENTRSDSMRDCVLSICLGETAAHSKSLYEI